MQTESTTILPARGQDTVEILINDHKVIRELLHSLTASHGAKRADAFEQLKGVMTIHNATEENLVYPALNKVARKRMESQHLYHETADADVLVFEADTLLQRGEQDAFAEKLQEIRDAILEHMDDEEQKAFPHLQEGANPEQSALLAKSVREFRSSLRFAPA